jgi:hypothetical protein
MLRTPDIDSKELFPYKLSPLSVVMEKVTPQKCPLNAIYIRVFKEDIAQFTVLQRV